jgi:hypothetical protein
MAAVDRPNHRQMKEKESEMFDPINKTRIQK